MIIADMPSHGILYNISLEITLCSKCKSAGSNCVFAVLMRNELMSTICLAMISTINSLVSKPTIHNRSSFVGINGLAVSTIGCVMTV